MQTVAVVAEAGMVVDKHAGAAAAGKEIDDETCRKKMLDPGDNADADWGHAVLVLCVMQQQQQQQQQHIYVKVRL